MEKIVFSVPPSKYLNPEEDLEFEKQAEGPISINLEHNPNTILTLYNSKNQVIISEFSESTPQNIITKKKKHQFSKMKQKPLTSTKNNYKFLLTKSILPIFVGSVIIIGSIFLQQRINDFCFNPSKCVCQNFAIYVYTCIREIIQGDSIMIIWCYGSLNLLTKNFFNRNYLKYGFFVFQALGFFVTFAFFYEKRQTEVLFYFRIKEIVI